MQTSLLYRLSIRFLMGGLCSVSGYSQNTNSGNQQSAIGGYSPVSYFSKNIAEHGSVGFAVEHAGNTYYPR